MGQTSAGLANGGRTAHYQISYDTSLPPVAGVTRAELLLDACEPDLALMQTWFGGVQYPYAFPISVELNNATGGASWQSPPTSWPNYHPTVAINGVPDSTPEFARYLLVSEVTEMFMAAMGDGWFQGRNFTHGGDEGSMGEGLSRFLGRQFMIANNLANTRFQGFEIVWKWLNAPGRPNFVDGNPDDNQPDVVTGCATCFIFFLHDQLGFGISDIIHANAPTLGGVYHNLTGRTDAFAALSTLVNSHYPTSVTYAPNRGNIGPEDLFPAPNLTSLSGAQILAGTSAPASWVALDNRAPAAVTVALASDDPAVLTLPTHADFGVGVWSAGIQLQAAAVTGPAQSVTIRATYAGKTTSASVEVLPRPSILQGQVRYADGSGVPDASIMIQSDQIILASGGTTVQLSTDSNGFYRSPALPPRSYQVSAAQSGYVPATATVIVGEGVPVTPQDFTLVLALTFTVDGVVTDQAGVAVAGATVGLAPGPKVTTDASGHFSISMNPGAFAGPFEVFASAPGYVSATAELMIPNGATVTANLELMALGSLTGIVGDASQTPIQPIAGATVKVDVGVGAGLAPPGFSSVTDATGRYTLTGIVPGSVDVTVMAAGFDTADVAVSTVAGAATIQNFVLSAASAVLTGTVTNAETGDSVGNARIRAGGQAVGVGPLATFTITGLSAGKTQVSAAAPGYVPQQTLVQLFDHETLELEFTMTRRASPGPGPGPGHQPQ